MGFSHGVSVNDVDRDEDLDIITTSVQWQDNPGGGEVICHVNDGLGNFTAQVCAGQFGFAVTSGDFNGDSHVDLIVSGGFHNPDYDRNSSKIHNRTIIIFGDSSGKFKKFGEELPIAYDRANGQPLSSIPELTAWDFDHDGDLDIVGSGNGYIYSGGEWNVWENDGTGNFQLVTQVPLIPGESHWTSKKSKDFPPREGSLYTSYCGRSVLIDINSDDLMDVLCDGVRQDKHNGWFFINEGNLNFSKISPTQAQKNGWVRYFSSYN